MPWISTNSPERARMGTDTVPVHPAIVPVNGECIFCSVTSYSIASRGSISKLDVSESDYMSCDNCSSQFCIGCINELIESVKGFNTIPPNVKMSDPTLRKIINIQKKMRSAITSTDFGPCCLFRVLDIRSALVKTPRPVPPFNAVASNLSRITDNLLERSTQTRTS